MQWLTIYVFLLEFCKVFVQVIGTSSEFSLQGDYLLGGLFSLNSVSTKVRHSYPVALDCFRYSFDESSYRMFEMMRYTVEEINNSSTLLPDVSLGYQIFDYCSAMQNFPSVFNFMSKNGSIPVLKYFNKYEPKIIAVTGPYGSSSTITVAPLFTLALVPMVNYGSTSYQLSNKYIYPSFLRTVPNNKNLVDIIIHIIKWFGWNWVAFIGSQDDYSQDGLNFFIQYAKNNNICLAHQDLLNQTSNYISTLNTIEKRNIKIIVVFSSQEVATNLIRAAIKNKIVNKVWIASEVWSMNKQLPSEPGIQNIGKIFGITEQQVSFPGFKQFIYNRQSNINDKYKEKKMCNQDCNNCSLLSSEEIFNENPTFSFPIYAAIYTMATALHKVLQCNANGCNKSIPVYPFMLLKEMKKLDFPLNGRKVKYDQHGDPHVFYSVVFWRLETSPPVFERIGTYSSYPEIAFTINNSLISWGRNASVPFANCSTECSPGYRMEKDKNYACCFVCKICEINTYVNYTQDPYTCKSCNLDEWSEEGSTSCQKRTILYFQETNPLSIIITVFAAILLVLCVAVVMLFSYNYNTPVVKSAGGNMCFIMLASLALSSISVFFFLGQPTEMHCIFRNVMFYFFYSVCLSCMTVRSFQIFCIFKMSAKFPKINRLWVQYNAQWIVTGTLSAVSAFVCILWISQKTPSPKNIYVDDTLILGCSPGNQQTFFISVFFTWSLSVLCFSFSYMSTDLPKNYNEAKSITFSMLLFFISWSFYFTVTKFPLGLYIQFFNAGAQLSSSYGILMSYFIPKSYVIIFQPQRNTQAYFQTSIQNYTQTMSRM
ncbi:taste receptor, type 1, member 2, tandem duplicate 2 precursor, partial [Silurus asotus]